MPLRRKRRRVGAGDGDACTRLGILPVAFDPTAQSAISRHFVGGAFLDAPDWPVHGSRFLPTVATTGWFVWVGPNAGEPDFFTSVRSLDLVNWAPLLQPYLGLPPGWRFMLGPKYDDVWFDEKLLI
jgi:hypothetical protein